MLQKINISDKCCFSELYSSKKPEQFYNTVFNNNNNNKSFFLSSKSDYYNDFWRIVDTNDATKSALKSQE